RLDEIPLAAYRAPAGDELGSVALARLDILKDPVSLRFADQRAHLRILRQGSPDLQSPRAGFKPRYNAFVDAFMGEKARVGRAVLAGLEKNHRRDRLRCGLDVRIRQNDDRGLSTQLERDSLER